MASIMPVCEHARPYGSQNTVTIHHGSIGSISRFFLHSVCLFPNSPTLLFNRKRCEACLTVFSDPLKFSKNKSLPQHLCKNCWLGATQPDPDGLWDWVRLTLYPHGLPPAYVNWLRMRAILRSRSAKGNSAYELESLILGLFKKEVDRGRETCYLDAAPQETGLNLEVNKQNQEVHFI